MEHILSLSYGKDSLACLGAIEQLGWPLDRIVHAEVWATDTIPADLPPMVEFKAKADTIIKERWGIEVEHIRADVSYEDVFYSVYQSGKRKGTIYGWPFLLGNWCQSRLKAATFDKARLNNGVIKYLGIAANESNRFHNLTETKRSPLVEAGWDEAYCRKWCEENDLLSPIYTTAARGGCWFCHNQSVEQLRLLRYNYPDLWAKMLEWDSHSPVTFKPNKHTVADYDARFAAEDAGLVPIGSKFRWSMLPNNTINTRRRCGDLIQGGNQMLVKTTYNVSVDIVSAEGATLQSREGTVWHRRGDLDEPDHAAYCSSPSGVGSVIQLSKSDLVRICKGTRAIQTPTTVEELRAATMDFDSEAYALANEKPDQWFREVLIEAEDTNQNPASLARYLLRDEIRRNRPVEEPKETPVEATEKPSSPPKRVTKGRRTPRAKLQPGGFEGTFEGNRVLLTPKQVEFMERIDEIGESYQTEDGVWYPTDIYTECLSDTMSPMSVGAVITTLREKGAIETDYCRMAGRKVCKFRLTAVGQYVYDNLRSGKVH